MAGNTISTSDVATARTELAGMRRALSSWLKYRGIGDAVLAGTAQTRKPLPYAQRVIAANRDMSVEQDLATKLYALLSTVSPDLALPSADLGADPDAAVALARIAIGGAPAQVASPQATGGVMATHPWLIPVLIAGGLLIGVTTAIKSAADVASTKEQTACIEAGACTDYGFWLKAGGVVMLAWFAWRELGVGDIVKDAIHKKRRT